MEVKNPLLHRGVAEVVLHTVIGKLYKFIFKRNSLHKFYKEQLHMHLATEHSDSHSVCFLI